jgi:hypothetical protein
MSSVPNATIIGFTETPIAKTEEGEGTFKIFGYFDERGYLDKYSIAESIEDETTLPIKHVMAPSVMTLRLLAWSRLLSPSKTEHDLLSPILFHCVDDAGQPAMPLATPRYANAWRDIPATIEALRQFWMPIRLQARGVGRPRPCSSRTAFEPSASSERTSAPASPP